MRNHYWRGCDGRCWFRRNAGCSSAGGRGRRSSPPDGQQGSQNGDRTFEGRKIGAAASHFVLIDQIRLRGVFLFVYFLSIFCFTMYFWIWSMVLWIGTGL